MKRILDACDEEGAPYPHYEIRPGSVVVVFERKTAGASSENVHKDVHKDVYKKLTDRQIDILKMMRDAPTITYPQMSIRLHLSAKTVQRAVEDMPQAVHHEGGTYGGRWCIDPDFDIENL